MGSQRSTTWPTYANIKRSTNTIRSASSSINQRESHYKATFATKKLQNKTPCYNFLTLHSSFLLHSTWPLYRTAASRPRVWRSSITFSKVSIQSPLELYRYCGDRLVRLSGLVAFNPRGLSENMTTRLVSRKKVLVALQILQEKEEVSSSNSCETYKHCFTLLCDSVGPEIQTS